MPILTNPKHELFAQALADGKSQFEAHGAAGYKAHRSTASGLARDPNISARVSEILAEREAIHAQATAKAIAATGLTKEWIIETLRQNVERAMTAEPVMRDGALTGEYRYEGAVANRALELLGKEIGMFVSKTESETKVTVVDEREALRREIAETIGASSAKSLNGKGLVH